MKTSSYWVDWVQRLPTMEAQEGIMAAFSGVPLEVVQENTDRLIGDLGRPLTREDFGYPRRMTADEILGHVEAAVLSLLDDIDARPLVRARFDVLFGY